mmetsp:Transcript_118768/g.343487  ORF Transcript_118768/g.343487 Transcript_118768/m.343487 type:complete len:206 (+) Transcript_118768:236-853(+)
MLHRQEEGSHLVVSDAQHVPADEFPLQEDRGELLHVLRALLACGLLVLRRGRIAENRINARASVRGADGHEAIDGPINEAALLSVLGVEVRGIGLGEIAEQCTALGQAVVAILQRGHLPERVDLQVVVCLERIEHRGFELAAARRRDDQSGSHNVHGPGEAVELALARRCRVVHSLGGTLEPLAGQHLARLGLRIHHLLHSPAAG